MDDSSHSSGINNRNLPSNHITSLSRHESKLSELSINSVNKEELELDELGGRNTLMDDNDSADDNESDNEDNYFCTQGDNKESFTFGSQAGLCTQVRDSQDYSDSDEDMEHVGVALGIQDEDDTRSLGSKDSASDKEDGKERTSDSYSPKIECNGTNLGDTINTEEIDYSQKGESSKNNNADGNPEFRGDFEDVSEHAEYLEHAVDAAAEVEEIEFESEEQNSRKKLECSEATLLYEGSLSQSPLKLLPTRFDQEDDSGNTDNEATGFTENEHCSDEPDTSIMGIGVNGNKAMVEEPSASEDKIAHGHTLGVAELGEIQPGFTEDTQSQSQSQNGGESVEPTPSVTEPNEEKKEASPGGVKHLPRAIVIKSGAHTSMASKCDEVLQEATKDIVRDEKSAFTDDDNFDADRHDNRNEQELAVFMGDTQSIPSQFPLTLEDKGGDQGAEHYTPKLASRSTERTNSPIPSHSSASLKSPLRYTDDSFCAGSTEKITDETASVRSNNTTSVPHENSSGHKDDVCGTLDFDSKVVDFESPSKQESQPPLGDGKEAKSLVDPLNHNTLKGTAEKSILNLTSTPHDDCLSYPKDFLSNKSPGTETLSTTPQSQILLESTSHKKPIFFAIDKLSNLRTAATSKADDAIENSSDEDEIVEDPSQNSKDDSQKQRMEMKNSVKKGSLKGVDSKQPISTNGWLEANRKRTQVGKRIETKYDSSLSNEKEQIASADLFSKPTGLSECESDDNDDFVKKSNKSSSSSCLIDTQPEDTGDEFDAEDDKPLTHLRNLKKGIPASRCGAEDGDEGSSSSSSEEENEFTDGENYVESSQNTRAIKSQLQKLENFDVKTLTEKLLKAPVGENVELKNHITELTLKNSELQKANKRLVKEKESMRKQLLATNVQMKGKFSLIDQMRKKLDEYKPLLDAVQKISESNEIKVKTTKPGRSPKNNVKKSPPVDKTEASPVLPKSRRVKSSAKKVVESDKDKEVYTTPKRKNAAASKEKVSIVSVSNRKMKRKSIGEFTFGNLWKILRTEHGWKYRNAPIPLAGQVYVPPNGSVEVGAKVGVDFFEADDLLWKMAEHLGIIDSEVKSQEDFEGKDEQKNVPSIKERRDTLSKADTPRGQMKKEDNCMEPQILIPVVEEVISESEEELELDNSKLYGKLGTLTEASLNRCCSLLREFLQLRTKGVFMRHLFGPIWYCLNNSQGAIDKEIAWRYCKSKGINLGSPYWFCPPKSKGSKGDYGIDYFTTEEAVISHVLREVKEYHSFDMEGVHDLEIKLSRAIEQHIPFDEIKSSSASDTRLGTRRIVSNEISSKTKSSSPRQSKRTVDDTPSVVSVSDTTIKTRNMSPVMPPPKKQRVVTFSQNTMEGAKILMNLNKTEYENLATPLGIKELLKFRRRATKKRKAEEKKEDRPSRKREKLSPAAMCHLTQNPDDAQAVSFQSPESRRIKSADKKNLPLYELLFFGSGVTDEIKTAVNRLGGTYLNDVSGTYLREEMVGKKMFFLSDVKFRRTHKYILASALGVPMLNIQWVAALETQFIEVQRNGGKAPSAFDSRLYSRHRLPLGLSSATGIFVLQKARNAKLWSRPTNESGGLLFEGISIVIALENPDHEKKWSDILQAVGATVVNASVIDRKDIKLDIVLVDSVNMPPHVTAIPSRVGKILNRASSYQPNAVVVDLSWATQCIIQRTLLETDDDRRYRVDMSKGNSPKKEIYSIKVKQYNGLTRYEVGDLIQFSKKRGGESEPSQGRIISIAHNKSTKKNNVDVKVMERHNGSELMDGGKGVYTVTVEQSEIEAHIVILGGKDFDDVAWSVQSNVFLQKKT